MSYERFTTTYHRNLRAPRTAGQAFKDADYASPLEIHVNKRRMLVQDALVSVGVIAFLLLLWLW